MLVEIIPTISLSLTSDLWDSRLWLWGHWYKLARCPNVWHKAHPIQNVTSSNQFLDFPYCLAEKWVGYCRSKRCGTNFERVSNGHNSRRPTDEKQKMLTWKARWLFAERCKFHERWRRSPQCPSHNSQLSCWMSWTAEAWSETSQFEIWSAMLWTCNFSFILGLEWYILVI